MHGLKRQIGFHPVPSQLALPPYAVPPLSVCTTTVLWNAATLSLQVGGPRVGEVAFAAPVVRALQQRVRALRHRY